MSRKNVAMMFAIVVVLGDFLQPVFLSWRPKFYGAIAGGFIFSALAIGLYFEKSWAAWGMALMPIIPGVTLLSFVISNNLGLSLPVNPDIYTVMVFIPQLLGGFVAMSLLRGSTASDADVRALPRRRRTTKTKQAA